MTVRQKCSGWLTSTAVYMLVLMVLVLWPVSPKPADSDWVVTRLSRHATIEDTQTGNTAFNAPPAIATQVVCAKPITPVIREPAILALEIPKQIPPVDPGLMTIIYGPSKDAKPLEKPKPPAVKKRRPQKPSWPRRAVPLVRNRPPSPRPQVYRITVPATVTYVTVCNLRPGQTVEVTATGTWRLSAKPGYNTPHGPDGIKGQCALRGVIDNNSFRVGSRWRGVSRIGGPFMLGTDQKNPAGSGRLFATVKVR
jgi:hypothetical protein